MRPVALDLCLLGVLSAAACYNPQIQDGGLKCGPASECPSGYTCSTVDSRCHKQGVAVVPLDGPGGAGGGPGTDGAEGMCTMAVAPYGPFEGCAASTTGGCDQVCQAGCACNEVCRPAAGGAVCKAQPQPFAQQYERCDNGNDTCRPGMICIEELENRPDCAAHCYRLCKTDANCPTGATCTETIQVGGQAVGNACSIPVEECNPFGQAKCAMQLLRPLPSFACYMVPGNPDLTACQCAGMVKVGDSCKYRFDCEAGAECIGVAGGTPGGGIGYCRKVCAIGALAGGGACPTGQACIKIAKGTKFGYCS
jgi:hypothetical protein